MFRQLAAVFLLWFGFAVVTMAADVPGDETAFTSYIQTKLQLYSPLPVNVVGPLSLSAGAATTAVSLPSLNPLHELCVASPSKCDGAVNDYVQNVTREFLQNPARPSAWSGQTQLVVCNRTTRMVQLASIYVPVSDTQWRSTGWMPLDPGMCRGILQTTRPVFYARAEDAVRNAMHDPHTTGGMTEGDVTIANAGGDIMLCVPHVGDWNDRAETLDNLCKSNREPTKFRTFHENGNPMQIWNLES
jgi:Protein of unknown function (DUF1036)